jgi:hypothetical protein
VNPWDQPTPDQTAYVTALRKQLRLTTPLLDAQCDRMFRKPFARLSKRECSRLIDELLTWKAIPAELQRAQGQADLPGFGP